MLSVSGKVAIVAALEREVRPLIRNWQSCERKHEGRKFKFFENQWAVAVCGGMGREPARRATEAVIALYHPSLVISAGFAGALDSTMAVGDIHTPRFVIDAGDGSRTDTGTGTGSLVSADAVVRPEQKAKLARAYGAQAVDMEAAAVARGAQAREIKFKAIKAISDDTKFVMTPMERFVSWDGRFRGGRFMVFALLRPWLWANIVGLARNSSFAARALCRALEQCSHGESNHAIERLQAVPGK